ncbi:MAG: patatin family protein [Oscillospiraceae bacterium]
MSDNGKDRAALPVSLILEGGGMRGAYTAGVLDAFLDHDIWFQRLYGVSAGACHAVSYLSNQRGRAIRTVTDYLRDKHYAGLYSLITTGDFFGVEMIYHTIPEKLIPYDYDAFPQSPTEMFAVLTDCETGEAVYYPVREMREDGMTAIRASSSLPFLSRMVEIGGRLYLDGGIADSIPVKKAKADGLPRGVVILTRHREYRKGGASMKELTKLFYRKYPALAEAILSRGERYNATLDYIEEAEAAGELFVIRPKEPVTIGRLEKDPDKLMALYRQGIQDGEAQMEALKAFCKA